MLIRRTLLTAAIGALLLLAPAAASADELNFSDSVGNDCTYAIVYQTDGGTWSGSVNCSDDGIVATAAGKVDTKKLTLDSATVTYAGFTATLANLKTIIGSIGDPTDPASWKKAAPTILATLDTMAGGRSGFGTGATFAAGPDALLAAANDVAKVTQAWSDNCSQLNHNPSPLDNCFNLPPSAGEGGPGPYGIPGGALVRPAPPLPPGVTTQEQNNQEAACPAAAPNTQFLLVCVPTYLNGALDLGKQDMIITGGALIALPVGSTLDDPATPSIRTKGAFVVAGGVVGGVNLKVSAGSGFIVGVGIVSMLRRLDVTTGTLAIGQVSRETIQKLAGESLPDQVLPNAQSIDTPALVYAPSISVVAKAAEIDAKGVMSSSGLGGAGSLFSSLGGKAPGDKAATGSFGGSYGGLGGWPINTDPFRPYAGPAGPGSTLGDPFDPKDLGRGGGGGGTIEAAGNPGGGVVTLKVATGLKVNGTIRSDGDATGSPAGQGDHGGGGSGGAVNLRVGGTLTGHGDISADGGDFCAACLNGGGGMGGGGRIAIRYATDSFGGHVHAYGGRDLHWVKNTPIGQGWGGAGTVFEQKVAVGGAKSKSTLDTSGTLIIDGGRGTDYPTPGPTPLDRKWSNGHRTLVISGGARVQAVNANYGEIDIRDGGKLTTTPGATRLDVRASKLVVGRTGRIDVTGDGFAGGINDPNGGPGPGTTGRGAKAATLGFGGSHGGKGGSVTHDPAAGATAGTTYDSKTNPSQPGAGGGGEPDGSAGLAGGGVLFVTADELVLDGRLMADGLSGDGPTRDDERAFNFTGGAGAGGTVSVKVGKISGAGSVEARGGSVCLASSKLLPFADGCTGGAGGGGGGGRILLSIGGTWSGTTDASGGANDTDTKNSRAKDGTVVKK
jgi:hypothetical protein